MYLVLSFFEHDNLRQIEELFKKKPELMNSGFTFYK